MNVKNLLVVISFALFYLAAAHPHATYWRSHAPGRRLHARQLPSPAWTDKLEMEPTWGTFPLNSQMVITKGLGYSHLDYPMLVDTTQSCTWTVNDPGTSSPRHTEVEKFACAYHGGSTYITGRPYLVEMGLAGYEVNNQEMLFVGSADVHSSRAGGPEAFLQGGLAKGVLGLYPNLTLLDADAMSKGHQAHIDGEHFVAPFQSAYLMNGGPKKYVEIDLPREGQEGKLVLGGRLNRTTSVGVDTDFQVAGEDGALKPTIPVEGFCLYFGTCNGDDSVHWVENWYVLDSLAAVILVPKPVADDVVRWFFPNLAKTYTVDTTTKEQWYEVPCDAKPYPMGVNIGYRVFRIDGGDLVVRMPNNICVLGIQEAPAGRLPRLGQPFWRNVVVGLDFEEWRVRVRQ